MKNGNVSQEQLASEITELLAHGGTLGSIYDYTEADYEVLYALGHSLYSQARYFDAMKAFGYLVVHNHLEKRFLMAFASSLQMLKVYQDAIKYYSMATVMDMTDPKPIFHVAECLLGLGMVKEAKEGLEVALGQCQGDVHEPLKARVQALLDLISKQSSH